MAIFSNEEKFQELSAESLCSCDFDEAGTNDVGANGGRERLEEEREPLQQAAVPADAPDLPHRHARLRAAVPDRPEGVRAEAFDVSNSELEWLFSNFEFSNFFLTFF